MPKGPLKGKPIDQDEFNKYKKQYADIFDVLRTVVPKPVDASSPASIYVHSLVSGFVFSKKLVVDLLNASDADGNTADYLIISAAAVYDEADNKYGHPTIILTPGFESDMRDTRNNAVIYSSLNRDGGGSIENPGIITEPPKGGIRLAGDMAIYFSAVD